MNTSDPPPTPLVENGPLLSIVVPTEGRQQAIAELIASVHEAWRTHVAATQESRPPHMLLELLLIDSSDPLLDPRDFTGWDPTWMSVRQGSRNVRQKRNQGGSDARGRWIGFVDSDCLVTTTYFTGVLAGIARRGARAFAGRVEFHGRENLVWRIVAASGLVSPESQTASEGETTWCATANLLVQRELFQSLGGFDETLPFRLGGDDVDFGLRLKRSGNALQVLPEALVIHPREPWSKLPAILRRTWRWGRVEYHLARRHPDKLHAAPPFFTATTLTMALACCASALLTQRFVLGWMLPLWIAVSAALFTFLARRPGSPDFMARYLGMWLARLYHLGAAREYLGAGSFRFFATALILDDRLEDLFPIEPLQSWSDLLAALVVAVVGMVLVAR